MSSVTAKTVGLTWSAPESDGGRPVTEYVVEQRLATKRAWKTIESTSLLEATASKLKTGSPYVFRVAAKNDVGLGPFAELPQPVTPASEFGEYTCHGRLAGGGSRSGTNYGRNMSNDDS